eukprot:TRINITY_DN113365_c0_g1_i1.p1 TRINITY_DN113365_c0_g1~~TRINITY_DN113365_c0_g1_i1.p1  ORF type:complete len:289 (+),score=14.41 TRINITY_DN113365_c0_g1_i1:100-966(+)
MDEWVGFCSNHEALCQHVWWCGWKRLAAAIPTLTGIWLCFFQFLLRAVYPVAREKFLKRVPSKFSNEETPHWFAWHVTSVCHCCVVLSYAVGPVWRATGGTPEELHGSVTTWSEIAIACCKLGIIFVCFLIADIVNILIYKLDDVLMVFHHLIFIAWTILVMYDCFLQYVSASMILLEISTVFLNYYSFFRNRQGIVPQWTVTCSFVLFSISYIVFRIVFLGYLLFILGQAILEGSVAWHRAGVGGVPNSHLAFFMFCLLAAWALQFTWLIRGIMPKLKKKLQKKGDE